jgi:hypothetical protein
VRPLSRSDASASFFFRPDPLLLTMANGEAAHAASPLPRPRTSVLVLPPLDDDMDAELHDTAELNLLDYLTDDILELILHACPASTLRECKAVDKRTHEIAKRLLQAPKFQLRRSLFGGGRKTLRDAARRVLDAKFVPPAPPTDRLVSVSLRLSRGGGDDVGGGGADDGADGGVRLRLSAPPRVRLSDDRTTLTKPAGGGWATILMDKWANSFQKEVVTVGLAFERLSGPACVGVVGLNFLASRAVGGGGGGGVGEAAPLDSRHAIVIDSVTGALRVKGASTPLALPRERVLRPGEARSPVLGSGSRLNVILNMATREMTIELLKSHSADPWAVSTLEVEKLPHEVCICVGLGPCGGESVVRMVGCKTQPADVRADFGKTLLDLWDESNVVTPLHKRARATEARSSRVPPGELHGAVTGDALLEEAMAMAEEQGLL